MGAVRRLEPVAPAFAGMRTPLSIAHRGGMALAPANTMAAFDLAASHGADVFETDVHMTADGELVTIHDATVDATTDGSGRVNTSTYAELAKLDAGHRFPGPRGDFPYRGTGVTVPRLADLFAAYGGTHGFNIDIKAPYPGVEAALWKLIASYDVTERVVVAAFDQRRLQRFRAVSGGRVALGAGVAEVRRFVLAHKLRCPWLYRPRAAVLQIPVAAAGLDLEDRRLIDGAHRHGLQVHYWTINDEPTMRELLALGADGVMTDRPDLLRQVLGR
ncbi:MAG: glycerophosphodiester phosphodiesterase [Streptosporangiales bacterium]|nr:glycerophosphodiester phosphodiesterase [Streptosporangiales bacterium]